MSLSKQIADNIFYIDGESLTPQNLELIVRNNYKI